MQLTIDAVTRIKMLIIIIFLLLIIVWRRFGMNGVVNYNIDVVDFNILKHLLLKLLWKSNNFVLMSYGGIYLEISMI